MDQTPGLENYVSGYLNQDWPELFGDVWSALDAFLDREPGARSTIVSEIDWVLRTFPTEAATCRYLDDIGCEYAADWDGGTYRGWLEEVARRVAATDPAEQE